MSIPSQNEGLVYIGLITGSARDPGDLYMNLSNINIIDDFLGNSYSRTGSPIRLHLGAYTFQYATIDVPMSGLNSELFDNVDVIPFSFGVEQADGSVALNPNDPGYFPTDTTDSQITAQTRLRVFPGRDSTLPVFLDDTMFGINSSNTAVTLNQSIFQTVNQPNTSDSSTSGKIAGFLSDMVQFDLTHIPAANIPKLMVSGKSATHFYLSGDNYAMSDDQSSTQAGNFEELTLDPTSPMDGTMGQPSPVPSSGLDGFPGSGQGVNSGFPGTYNLVQANPVLFAPNPTITSLFGRWRSVTNLVNLSQSTFDIIVFPNSNETYTTNVPADAVAIAHTGNTITNFYIGSAAFTSSTGGAPIARFYPLPSFVTGSVTGEVDFSLSGFMNAGGASTTDEPSIRSGTFTKTGSGTLPAGFAASGTFVVFR